MARVSGGRRSFTSFGARPEACRRPPSTSRPRALPLPRPGKYTRPRAVGVADILAFMVFSPTRARPRRRSSLEEVWRSIESAPYTGARADIPIRSSPRRPDCVPGKTAHGIERVGGQGNRQGPIYSALGGKTVRAPQRAGQLIWQAEPRPLPICFGMSAGARHAGWTSARSISDCSSPVSRVDGFFLIARNSDPAGQEHRGTRAHRGVHQIEGDAADRVVIGKASARRRALGSEAARIRDFQFTARPTRLGPASRAGWRARFGGAASTVFDRSSSARVGRVERFAGSVVTRLNATLLPRFRPARATRAERIKSFARSCDFGSRLNSCICDALSYLPGATWVSPPDSSGPSVDALAGVVTHFRIARSVRRAPEPRERMPPRCSARNAAPLRDLIGRCAELRQRPLRLALFRWIRVCRAAHRPRAAGAAPDGPTGAS